MKSLGVALALWALLLGAGWVLPDWIVFLLALALAKGLAVLGVVLLLRAGLVSFGQGLFFAGGAYAVGFAMKLWGVQEALIAVGLGVMAGVVLALLTGLLMARYREIFFAMLTLAFSMILYGVLVKAYTVTGGSDGLRILSPTIFGFAPARARLALYAFTLTWVVGVVYLIDRYLRSPLGYAARAIRDNEVRMEYLGVSVSQVLFWTYVIAAAVSGLGGALAALNVGHIDPQLAYWTTSGEFVFVALLGGTGNVIAPLGGAVLFELMRAYASKYAPYTWQMTVGLLMLAVILFLPDGLWTLYGMLTRRARRWPLSWRRSG